MPVLPLLPAAMLAASILSAAAAPVQDRAMAAGQGAPREVPPGDPLRRALLDTLRPAIERDLGQPVRFLVRTLRSQGRWAFVVATPQTPGGGPIDLASTRYAEQLREDMLDGDTAYALLERKAGGWQVRAFVIGPTDVAHADWPERHGVPAALLGLPQP